MNKGFSLLYLLGLAPNSLVLIPGRICRAIMSNLASRVLSTFIFPFWAKISIPPVLGRKDYNGKEENF